MPSLTRSSEPAAAMTVAPITFLAIWMPMRAEIAAGAHDQHGLAAS